uniref:T-complex protein 1 subunit delta n=1 Tax=Megaselia scalaris TaxID=36166 RepID=T1GU09_MEGSC
MNTNRAQKFKRECSATKQKECSDIRTSNITAAKAVSDAIRSRAQNMKALLEAAEKLLQKEIHLIAISDSFQCCAYKALNILTEMSTPIDQECIRQNPGPTISIICRGSNKLTLEEAVRYLHDANTLDGVNACCFRAFAEALEVIPLSLAENAGLNPIATVTEFRNRHANGDNTAGIN